MKRSLLLLSLITLSVPALGSDKKVEDLLSKMRGAYTSVKSAKFEVKSTFNGPDGKESYTISTSYVNPNRMHVQRSDGKKKSIAIMDGKKMFMLDSGDTAASEKPFDSVQFSTFIRGINLETISFYESAVQLSTAKGGNMNTSTMSIEKSASWNGKSWTILREVAPVARVAVDYYIDPKTSLIHRAILSTQDRSRVLGDYQITKLELGAKINSKLFKKPSVDN